MHNSTTTPTAIAAAVEPLRAATVERAEKEARLLAEATLTDFAAFPQRYEYPSVLLGRRERQEQSSRRARLLHLVTNTGTTMTPKYERSEEAVQRFVKEAGTMASEQYTLFIRKLESKVGAHVSATLEGSHVWGFSELTVTKADGSKEKWRTQQIVNVSVLGKLFNQWPSRKVK
jgi:hypothetical protein